MIELLAPAGDLEKLKIALLYGADACYIGGTSFSLRARASNFDLLTIKEACDFAHSLNKKIYVTTNIIPHSEDLDGLEEYLIELEKCGVDAIICASPIIIETAKKSTNLEIHLSTQQSTLNSFAIKYWKNKGVKRIVLARELNIMEIEEISSLSDVDLEVFIHGGMCMSFSGRCSLSNWMTLRDANRGGCAHSCRWDYYLYNTDDEMLSTMNFSLSSKDLEAINMIPQLIEIGIKSLKIEGRMKSLHYIATVVNTYRLAIDEYMQTREIKDTSFYQKRLQKAENRLTASGFFNGDPHQDIQLYRSRSEEPSKTFVGIVKDYSDGYMIIEQRNFFIIGEEIEVFSKDGKERIFKVSEMYDLEGNVVDTARHPKQILKLKVPFAVNKDDMLRKVW